MTNAESVVRVHSYCHLFDNWQCSLLRIAQVHSYHNSFEIYNDDCPNCHVRGEGGREEGGGEGEYEEFERRRRGIMQPSQQLVEPCLKGVEWGLGMTDLRIGCSLTDICIVILAFIYQNCRRSRRGYIQYIYSPFVIEGVIYSHTNMKNLICILNKIYIQKMFSK